MEARTTTGRRSLSRRTGIRVRGFVCGMKLPPLNHVTLSVSDIERSAAFYENVLGYRRTLDSPVEQPVISGYLHAPPGLKGRMVMLQADYDRHVGMIELTQWDPPPAPPSGPKRPGDPGITFLALELPEGQTIETLREHLDAQGVPLWSDTTTIELAGYPPMRAVIVEDPDGVLIELVEVPPREVVRAFRAALREGQAAV